MKKALIMYCSFTGNTKKAAHSIETGLSQNGYETVLLPISEAKEEDFFAYDLVCFGTPSYNFTAPKPTADFLKNKFQEYKRAGYVKPGAPALPGKNALIFITYSGPHTGDREAIPTGLYIGQFFEHWGFTVQDIWYVLSEFVGDEECNTLGRMGDIRGLPSEADLKRLETQAYNLANRL